MDNPTQVRFVPSTDHATLTRYELRSVEVDTSNASSATSIGLPTPSGGYCTVDLETGGWTADLAYRVEVRSVRGADVSTWAPSSNTGQITEPPETVYGPQASIEPPEGAIMLTAGQTGAQLQALINANPVNTVFGIAAGVHLWSASVVPKNGNQFIGEYGAILDGQHTTPYAIYSNNLNQSNVTVSNLEIRNFTTPTVATGAVIGDNVTNWTVTYCSVHDNVHSGIRAGEGTGWIINHNLVYNNGQQGITGYKCHGAFVDDNEMRHNGNGPGTNNQAGTKMLAASNLTFRRNYVHDNHGRGIWSDTNYPTTLIEDNVVEDNAEAGIWHEISYAAIIRGNTVRRNGQPTVSGGWLVDRAGIQTTNSQNVEIYNNVVEGNRGGITAMSADTGGYPATGPHGAYLVQNLHVHDNTVTFTTGALGKNGIDSLSGGSAVYTSQNNVYEDNTYVLPTLSGSWFAWQEGFRTWAQWQAYGNDTDRIRNDSVIMAWTEFYMDTGGNSANVNAGTGGANTAPSVTSTNGDWSTTTNIFTPAGGGTPFSGVTANVDWASIYIDGATTTPFIARVASVNSGGATITLDTTIRIGTPPVTSATARTCKIGGSWASFAICTTGPFSAGTAGTPMRVNVQAATYANGATARTWAAAGATTAPIWIRGYTTTPGDLDDVANGTRPELTFTTARLQFTGAHTIISNLNVTVTGVVNNNAVSMSGGTSWMDRCRIDNQHVFSGSHALSSTTAVGNAITNCYLKATTTAVRVLNVTAFSEVTGCYLIGGISAIDGAAIATYRNCIIDSPTTDGFSLSNTGGNGNSRVLHCTVYNTVNGVKFTGLSAGYSVEDCLFHTVTTAINNTTGTNTNFVKRHNNSFYNVTTPETGFGDSPAFGALTESTDPLENPAGGDFTLIDGALSQGTASPVTFEFLALAANLDRGAVQAVAASGGGISRARLPSGLSAVG